ncbi:MAG: hypothetical protein ACI80S_002028, partial [Pseudohongiellaceae bacterium]
MKKIIKPLVISCLISTVSLASLAVAAPGSGTVVFKVGDPIVVNKQGSQNIVKGDELGSGDTILTQSGI